MTAILMTTRMRPRFWMNGSADGIIGPPPQAWPSTRPLELWTVHCAGVSAVAVTAKVTLESVQTSPTPGQTEAALTRRAEFRAPPAQLASHHQRSRPA